MSDPVRAIPEEKFQLAARSLDDLPFARLMGMKLLEMAPGKATISIGMRDDLRQPNGALHGGVTATLIDTAMAFAVMSLLAEGERVSTVDLTVHYLRPHTDGLFTCTANTVRGGSRIFTVAAEVFNDQGKMIATGLSTYAKI